MKSKVLLFVATFLSFSQLGVIAQAPAPAPAGATGQCKDGTYTQAAHKSGACTGHKGVQTWFGASGTPAAGTAPTNTAPAAPTANGAPSASTGTAAPSPANRAASGSARSAKTAAPGGGPGLVWVNTNSNVYHCYGAAYYGTTKSGKYMTEEAAKAAGAHPDHNRPCSTK
jgi:hypothetical protein